MAYFVPTSVVPIPVVFAPVFYAPVPLVFTPIVQQIIPAPIDPVPLVFAQVVPAPTDSTLVNVRIITESPVRYHKVGFEGESELLLVNELACKFPEGFNVNLNGSHYCVVVNDRESGDLPANPFQNEVTIRLPANTAVIPQEIGQAINFLKEVDVTFSHNAHHVVKLLTGTILLERNGDLDIRLLRDTYAILVLA